MKEYTAGGVNVLILSESNLDALQKHRWLQKGGRMIYVEDDATHYAEVNEP